jgi:hypothetical protein
MGRDVLFTLPSQGNGLENLSLSDPARIKEITSSGAPWFIVCYTGSENVPEFITKAAPKLKRGGIETGIVDCSAKFSDKKTLFKKLSLPGGGNKNALGNKRLLLVANGKKAVEMPGTDGSTGHLPPFHNVSHSGSLFGPISTAVPISAHPSAPRKSLDD